MTDTLRSTHLVNILKHLARPRFQQQVEKIRPHSMPPANKTTHELRGGPETNPGIQLPGAVCLGSHKPSYDQQSVVCQCGGDCNENLLTTFKEWIHFL